MVDVGVGVLMCWSVGVLVLVLVGVCGCWCYWVLVLMGAGVSECCSWWELVLELVSAGVMFVGLVFVGVGGC